MGEYCAGFDFHCVLATVGLIGELVRGRHVHRCRGEISWSDISDCERSDRDGLVCSPLDDKNERHETVPIEWVVILAVCFYPVFRVEGD